MTRRWERLLADAIDPVLAGSPFQAGQIGGSPDGAVSGIWCGPYDQVVTSYPHLAGHEDAADENVCFDVMVDVGTDGRLSRVQLEHVTLVRALEEMGRPNDAALAGALLGRPVEDAVPELADLLSRVFVVQPS